MERKGGEISETTIQIRYAVSLCLSANKKGTFHYLASFLNLSQVSISHATFQIDAFDFSLGSKSRPFCGV
ncbi:hypothetical protein LWI29_028583 [Acer saccharum]|uniref:Uncharacterized protein n=1 Tax=Acer saccharum TaxID=4024 RepID=A0AA39S3E0_ACESA|nr:hypothetical protein LWI29_028583 [Acer saccharum]